MTRGLGLLHVDASMFRFVRFWPLADMRLCTAHIRFQGRADMTRCGCLLLQSLLGVKRTCRCAPHMSAFDPKQTSLVAPQSYFYLMSLSSDAVAAR